MEHLWLTICVLVSVFSFAPISRAEEDCDKYEIEVLTTPSPSTNPLAVEDFLTKQYPSSADLLFLGDSIAVQVHNEWKFSGEGNFGSKFLYAFGGDQIQTAYDKLLKGGDKIADMKPKVAIVFLGTNSTQYAGCALEVGFEQYVRQFKKILPSTRLLVASILPRGTMFRQSDRSRLELNRYLFENQATLGYEFIEYNDNDLTCGIYSLAGSPEFRSLGLTSGGSSEACNLPDVEEFSYRAKAETSGTNVLCRATINMNCKNFNVDNTHLSAEGLAKVIAKLQSRL